MTEKRIYDAIDPLIKKKYDKRFVRSVSGIDDLLRKKRYTYDLSETEGDRLRLICLLNELYEENEQLKKEKEIIKDKLLKYIIEYHKIGNDNWNLGLREAVETMQTEVKDLFKNPLGWEYCFDCDDCTHFQETEDDDFDKGHCRKHNKEVACYMEGCEDFEWK